MRASLPLDVCICLAEEKEYVSKLQKASAGSSAEDILPEMRGEIIGNRAVGVEANVEDEELICHQQDGQQELREDLHR